MTMASEYAVKGPLTSLPALELASSETVIRSSASEFCTRSQVPAPPRNMIAPMTAMTIPLILTKPRLVWVLAAPAVGWVVVLLMVRPCPGGGAGVFRHHRFSYAA